MAHLGSNIELPHLYISAFAAVLDFIILNASNENIVFLSRPYTVSFYKIIWVISDSFNDYFPSFQPIKASAKEIAT